MPTKIGTNITIFDKENSVLIKINKNGNQKDSGSGKSKLLASSGGFAKVEGLTGDVFENKEVGLNLILSLRETKPAKVEATKTTKKKAKRMDDDD